MHQSFPEVPTGQPLRDEQRRLLLLRRQGREIPLALVRRQDRAQEEHQVRMEEQL